jgi:hypothetical protein
MTNLTDNELRALLEAAEARVRELEVALRYIADLTEAALDPKTDCMWGARDTLDCARSALGDTP